METEEFVVKLCYFQCSADNFCGLTIELSYVKNAAQADSFYIYLMSFAYVSFILGKIQNIKIESFQIPMGEMRLSFYLIYVSKLFLLLYRMVEGPATVDTALG